MLRTLILAAALALSAACATVQPAPPAHEHAAATTPANDSVLLVGPSGQSNLTRADLATMPRKTIRMSIHGADHVFEGVALTDILARVGAPSGQSLRGPALASVVLVTSRDDYRVALSLAETDAGIRTTGVILADTMDGAPISAEDGPFRLIVEGDLRPARSARMVTRIEVRTLAP
ncbi:MAG: molybdopterin-dependent oxidoreductase [Hyphomonadaceae bacterium]|nr:molybdopterin-dependent oxidoreductase [Hyphomonadaceae bacterium]